MAFNFHTNHQVLLITISLSFLALSTLIAVIPAYQVQNNNPPIPNTASTLSDSEWRGKQLFISEGCQNCHTQQVRSNIIDQSWGNRPSVPADYARNKRMSLFKNTASVLGSERTGPDLTNIGERQPGEIWHLLHLYNPRLVVKESIMPAYPWLFREVSEVKKGDKEIPLPENDQTVIGQHIITTEKVEDLVAYLKSLKQPDLPAYLKVEFNAYDWQKKPDIPFSSSEEPTQLNGAKLYAKNCQVCHQNDGQGVPGAFPKLAGSDVANAADPTYMIRTVLFGLDRANEFGAMIPFGQKLTDEEIAAIISFERSNWSNNGSDVTPEQVKEIRASGKPENWPL